MCMTGNWEIMQKCNSILNPHIFQILDLKGAHTTEDFIPLGFSVSILLNIGFGNLI